MAKETPREKGGFWKQIGVAVFIALIAGGTSPWWFEPVRDLINGSGGREIERTSSRRTYLMDNHQNRIIVVTHLQDEYYRIEEASSPWPWEGTATIVDSKLSGEATFRKTQGTMKVEGTVRSDGSIAVAYIFLTDGDGNPSSARHDHVWYPKT